MKNEGKEEKEPPQSVLDIIISIEGIRSEIVQGRGGVRKGDKERNKRTSPKNRMHGRKMEKKGRRAR